MASLVGKAALPFMLKGLGGDIHSCDDYRGSWLLLMFHRHLG